MSDKDDIRPRGIPFFSVVDELGVSTDGQSASMSLIRSRGMQPICEVNSSGVAASGSTLTALRARGIRFYCPVTENGVTADAVSMATLRTRGVPFFCPVGTDGVATGGTATMAQLAARGIPYVCLLDSLGGAGSPPAPNTLVAGAGSFVLSGETMTPLTDRRIPSAVGAFTLTGNDVTLTAATGDAAETTAFLARTSGLSGTETAAYKALINGMVADGTWAKLDALYIFATNTTTTANLNLISTSFPLVQSGGVTFTADQGYTGNGSTGYLDPTYAPATHGVAMTTNSISIGIYTTGSRTSDSGAVSIGLLGGGGLGYLYIQPKTTTNAVFFDVNGTTFPTTTVANAQGLWCATRTSSSAVALYRNGSSTAIASSGADTAATLSTGNLLILAAGGGPAANFNSDQQAAAFWGGGLTGAEYLAISNRINGYMTALGINVY